MTNEQISAAEIEGLKSATNAFLYTDLSGNVSTWTGDFVGNPIGYVTKSRTLWTWRIRDVHGQVWACRHWPSAGDYVRCRKVGV